MERFGPSVAPGTASVASQRNDARQGGPTPCAPLQQCDCNNERLQPSAPCSAALARRKGALGRCQRVAWGKSLQARRCTGTLRRFANLPATYAVHCKPAERSALTKMATICSCYLQGALRIKDKTVLYDNASHYIHA